MATNDPDPVRSVYIHVPFCAHHCGYCNFSVIAQRLDLADEYLDAIAWEMDHLAGKCDNPIELDTLYFGGGTPTQLSCDQLRRLFDITQTTFRLADDCEVTVEANPSDVHRAKIETLAELGVNRISLGAQSFEAAHLATLERDHRAEQIAAAVQLARELGIRSIALDLIFGIPEQTLDQWQQDLQEALALSPTHISTYGLTFETGAAFYSRLMRGELAQVEEESEREMYLSAIATLTTAGFEHYEVSNFALPGRRSRHNEVYWTGRPYLAFGPDAARFVDGCRETNHRSVTTYLKRIRERKSPVHERECLPPEDAARERLVFSLRRLEGLNIDQFEQTVGLELDALVGEALRECEELELLQRTDGRLRLTQKGLLVSDSIWPLFL